MKLHTLKSTANSRQKPKIVGRGIGSGMGKTSTRGHKGQLARKSGNVRIGFEGGQTPLIRRIPKRGFSNDYHQIQYCIINLDILNNLKDCKDVDMQVLIDKKIIKVPTSQNLKLKVLGDGEVKIPLNIKAHKFSASAIKKIEAAGGKVIVLENKEELASKK